MVFVKRCFVLSLMFAFCFDLQDLMYSPAFPIPQVCGDFTTDRSTVTFAVPPAIPILTAIEIQSYVPQDKGVTIVGCSDCLLCPVCVSIGAGRGAFSCITSKANICQ